MIWDNAILAGIPGFGLHYFGITPLVFPWMEFRGLGPFLGYTLAGIPGFGLHYFWISLFQLEFWDLGSIILGYSFPSWNPGIWGSNILGYLFPRDLGSIPPFQPRLHLEMGTDKISLSLEIPQRNLEHSRWDPFSDSLQNSTQTPMAVPGSPWEFLWFFPPRSPRGLSRSPWAVKKINSGCSKSQRSLYQQRLREEAQTLRNLQHPNIVGGNSAGMEGWDPWEWGWICWEWRGWSQFQREARGIWD